MVGHIDLVSYSLSFLPVVTGEEPVQLTPEMYEPERFLRNPVATTEDTGIVGFLSAYDQIGFTLGPPTIDIYDHSAQMPVRPSFVDAVAGLAGFLTERWFEIQSLTWTVDGALRDTTIDEFAQVTLNLPNLKNLLAGVDVETLFPPAFGLIYGTTFSDRTALQLFPDLEQPDSSAINFSMSAQFVGTPLSVDLQSQGDQFGRVAEETLLNLLNALGKESSS